MLQYRNGKLMTSDQPVTATTRIKVIKTDRAGEVTDYVVGEEPLEIRIETENGKQQLAVTMRTPGADNELGAGFLWSEGLLRTRDDLIAITSCKDADLSARERENIIVAHVKPGTPALTRILDRRFTISSACGVCGSTQIEDL